MCFAFCLVTEAASPGQERVSHAMGFTPSPQGITHTQEIISLPNPSPLAEGLTLESNETMQPGRNGCSWDAQWI